MSSDAPMPDTPRPRVAPDVLGCDRLDCGARFGCARSVLAFFDVSRPVGRFTPLERGECADHLPTDIPGPVHREARPGETVCGQGPVWAYLYTTRPELVTCEGCRRG